MSLHLTLAYVLSVLFLKYLYRVWKPCCQTKTNVEEAKVTLIATIWPFLSN